MKKYIRASISESTPDWLRRKLTNGRWGNTFKQALLNKYHIALDKANYTSQPTSPTSKPIYLLQVDYGTVVYMPGVNDDSTESINGRYRKLGSIAKSKLPDMAVDVVYVDPSDEANKAPDRSKYQDPRYSYRYSNKGDYAGQYKKTRYDRESGQEYPDGWSDQGMRPSNESRSRDKSGYRIPSPEERLTEFYTRFPDKLTSKVDALYNKLIDTRQMLVDTDFNTPRPSWRDRDTGDNVDYGRAFRRFADAVDDYRDLLSNMKDIERFGEDYGGISQFARTARDISERVDDIQKILEGENVW